VKNFSKCICKIDGMDKLESHCELYILALFLGREALLARVSHRIVRSLVGRGLAAEQAWTCFQRSMGKVDGMQEKGETSTKFNNP
jgi:hypothetical protein